MPHRTPLLSLVSSFRRDTSTEVYTLSDYLVPEVESLVTSRSRCASRRYILMPGVAEILLALWLFVMGVNVQRWKEQASAAGERQ